VAWTRSWGWWAGCWEDVWQAMLVVMEKSLVRAMPWVRVSARAWVMGAARAWAKAAGTASAMPWSECWSLMSVLVDLSVFSGAVHHRCCC